MAESQIASFRLGAEGGSEPAVTVSGATADGLAFVADVSSNLERHIVLPAAKVRSRKRRTRARVTA